MPANCRQAEPTPSAAEPRVGFDKALRPEVCVSPGRAYLTLTHWGRCQVKDMADTDDRQGLGARLVVTGAALVAMAGVAGLAIPAQARPSHVRSVEAIRHATSLKATPGTSHRLYSPNSNLAGAGISSQRFDRTRAIYNSRGADDFTEPTCRRRSGRVMRRRIAVTRRVW